MQRLFPQHAAAVNQIPTNLQVVNGPVADAGGNPSVDGRKRSMLPFLGNHDRRSSFKAVSPSARSAADLQQLPCQQVSDNSQSGSDEQSPTSSIEVNFLLKRGSSEVSYPSTEFTIGMYFIRYLM